ncbi:MAG TPA: MlaD family protein [Solirubrobacteraceae bacterium]|nr:MlaD family protein [Solirubrobacteraceae bacterium]
MTPRRQERRLGSPILIGAVTMLAAIIAVFLAYNANNGLPFVPRYTLHVEFANAAELTHGADVHLGGALVGSVSGIRAVRAPSGQPLAVADLALNQSIEPLPLDSTFRIRLKGAIGLKYVEVTPGHSRRGLPNGATVPLSRTSATVDLDQVLAMFDRRTRAGVLASTAGFGYGLAGRGADINDAVRAFVPLVDDLAPVARNLASPRTDLGGFFRGLESFSSAVAPVAQQQADLYANLDTTFAALAPVADPYLRQWISQTPPTFQAVITNGPRIDAFTTDAAALFAELNPGIATLPKSATPLADALQAGIRNLPGTSALDQRLVGLARYLEGYGENPTVQQGLDRLTLTAASLKSPLAFLAPVQTTCNYATLFLRNTASLLSPSVATGTTLQFLLVAIDDVLGGESVPSSRPYTTPDSNTGDNHGPLHSDPYPNTASPGQTAECSAGNERYSGAAAVIGNPPGNVGVHTELTKAAGR